MASAPPNEFNHLLAKWVYNKCIQSVVHVMHTPKDPTDVKEYIDQMDPIPKNERVSVKIKIEKKRKEESNEHRCSTGFVVGEDTRHMYVLTCAHSLDHVFSSKTSISVADIRRLFKTEILCDHAEARHRLELETPRRYVKAIVAQVNCMTDLLLLRVPLSSLGNVCREHHPALSIAHSIPDLLDTIVVLSWPPSRPRTACTGETSHSSREYSEVFVDDPTGYGMKLSEVSILTDSGSSGAPMIDGASDVVGVLHGGAQSSLCYFISCQDVRDALMAWGVI